MVLARVTLPPASPQHRGLLAAARSLSDLEPEWWRGITFSSLGCVGPQLMGPCEDEFTTVGPQVPDEVGEVRTFVPVETRQGVACSSLSGTDIGVVAGDRLDLTREWALGHVLQTGDHTTHVLSDASEVDNPALIDATDVGGGGILSVVDALSCLEQHIADELFGAPGNIHASPLLKTHLLHEQVIYSDGRRWLTAMGNVVIASPGYTGTTLYATSEVFVAAGQRGVNTAVDRTVNQTSAWAEDLVMAVFDPCWIGSVDVEVNDCVFT